MASIVPGFEYDIFISYRHNDNRSGWVTDFVNALQEELAATVKEPLSIYFDKNPHDGLLETHDVDGSLKDKLKCLIFIPIISRTYCDTKSFAWNSEFLEFLKIASADSFGLKVKLPNSNMASRVLPVRIHELDGNDKKSIEAELQGVLRPIDFTYKAAGINRPLLPKDDETIKASGQATYRDQINKTANAISDLIAGMEGKVVSIAQNFPANDQPMARQTTRKKKFNIPAFDKFQIAILLLSVSFLLLVIISISYFSKGNEIKPTYKATILPPNSTRFNSILGANLALSQDGSKLAFSALDSLGKSILYVRPLNSMNAKAFKGTEGALRPFWSPDNKHIGFFVDGKLKKLNILDGTIVTLCEAHISRGGSWNQDGVILFSTDGSAPISRVSANGGKTIRVTNFDTTRHDNNHRFPVFLPDGKHFLFTSRINASSPSNEDAIYLASLDTTFTPRIITKASSSLAYANGYLIYYKGTSLFAQSFDSNKFDLKGDPFKIADNLYYEPLSSNAAFTVSHNGLLVYQSGFSTDGAVTLEWRNRSGARLGDLTNGQFYNHVRISPDGKLVAVSKVNINALFDIWIYEINRDIWTRFTFDDGTKADPVWSPDNKMIAYRSDQTGMGAMYIKPANGTSPERPILQTSVFNIPDDWSPDGRFISYHTFPAAMSRDIWILPMKDNKPERDPFPFLQTEFNEWNAVFSPDGKWIAYQSDESGQIEIYIRPFPGLGGKWQVSTKGGTRPRWRADGKELFFAGPDLKGLVVGITTKDNAVIVGAEQTLFPFGSSLSFFGNTRSLFDVTRDGQKFLVETLQGDDFDMPVTLVVNWLEEQKKEK
jgi:Tol biopolymer transport system component